MKETRPEINKSVRLCITLVSSLILLTWIFYAFFIDYDAQSTLDMYQERHYTVLFMAEDTIKSTMRVGGEMGLHLLEGSLREQGRSYHSGGEVEKDFKDRVENKNLVGYGNLIVLSKSKPIFVSGDFSEYFEYNKKGIKFGNDQVRDMVLGMEQMSVKSRDSEPIVSDVKQFEGRDVICSAVNFPFTPGKLTVFLYADVQQVLASYDFFYRRNLFGGLALTLSLVIFAFGVVILKSLQRESENMFRLEESTEELQKEVSERIAAEELAIMSEARSRALLETMPLGVIECGEDCRILSANPAMLETFGRDGEEMIGSKLTDFISTEKYDFRLDEKVKEMAEALEDPIPFSCRARTSKGNEIDIRLEWTYKKDSAGNVTGYVCVVSDITDKLREREERERLKEQLMQSQKMEAIGKLAGGMAHEFNNMLGVILGYAGMLISDFEDDDPNKKRIRKMQEAAIRAREITVKLLTFSRREKLNVEPARASQLVNEMLPLFSTRSLSDIETTVIVKDDSVVNVDARQIQQALLNVAINASDAMPGGGSIDITIDKVEITNENAASNAGLGNGEYCRISIEDTGTGMERESIEKIFEPFYTTKESGRGTGLGLSVSLGIMTGHGGGIKVKSRPGAGTTMYLYIPVLNGEIPASDPQVEEQIDCSGDETILIIDDEPHIREMMNEGLSLFGYKVLQAAGGKEAIEQFREKGVEIDLVILDMIMPGVDGTEVFSKIRDIDPKIKVILSSGFSSDGKAGALIEAGASGFLQKPFKIEELCEKMRSVIDS